MSAPVDVAALATRLIAAYDGATSLLPITASLPAFDVAAAYDVLAEIERRRIGAGWRPVGRKIGFTNRTIWPRYGVYQPMAARIWSHTVRFAHAWPVAPGETWRSDYGSLGIEGLVLTLV